MKRTPDTLSTAEEGSHPLLAETRHRAHAVLAQPGLVEKAGWVAQRGAELTVNVLEEIAALTGTIVVGIGKILVRGIGSSAKELRRK